MILRVKDQSGKRRDIPAENGWRVMEIIRDAGLPIKAECGGACSCATCHVYVEGGWTAKIPPASAEEHAELDGAFAVRDNSRLSCQIIMNETLDGLEVTLAPGSEP